MTLSRRAIFSGRVGVGTRFVAAIFGTFLGVVFAQQSSAQTYIQAESYSSMSGVVNESTTDTGGGQDVGWIDANDWMTYSNINIPTTGKYTIAYRVSSLSSGGTLQFEQAGGAVVYGTATIPATGGWQTWTTVYQTVTLNAGTQSFGIKVLAGGWNLNWFSITPVTTSSSKSSASSVFSSSSSVASTAYVQAENYSDMNGILIENTTDTGGGQDVGWIDTNDWMTYSNINIPTAGKYTIAYRVASLSSGGTLQLEQAGGAVIYGTATIPATGGWQTWTTIYQTVTLSAGTQSFGIKVLSGGWNFNWFSITPADNSSQSSTSSSVAANSLKIVGYTPSWSTVESTIQYSKLTHINYAFVLPNANGSLQGVPNVGILQDIVTHGHQNNVKVVISIGGWNDGNDSNFVAMASTDAGRTAFVNSAISLVNQYNLDGVDIDWEYPNPGSESDNYTKLMGQLSTAMHSRGKILTAAVVAEGSTGGGITNQVFGYVDFLNLMAYDANNGDHSPYSYAVQSINYWAGRGLPSAKLVLGVPYYAHPSWADYRIKVSQNPANACRDTDGSDYWNGIPTIRKKAQLARSYGGIMTWELSEDTSGTNSLLTAMWEVITGRPSSFNCN